MAHHIAQHDVQQGTEMAWHQLTRVDSTITVDNNWLRTWDVTPRLMTLDGAATEYSRLVATDNSDIQIGVPFTDSYTPITNNVLLDTIKESFLGVKGVTLSSVGSIYNRNRIFLSFKLDEATKSIGDRKFENYINFGNSFDMSSPVWWGNSNICTVCANTYRLNRNAKGAFGAQAVSIKHTKNAKSRLIQIEQIIDQTLGAKAEFEAAFASLASAPISGDLAGDLFAGFLAGGDEMSTRTVNQANRLVKLFKTGAGNRGETLADAFSAVTDYYSHESSGDDVGKQFVSSEFGAGANSKNNFWDIVTNPALVSSTIAAGKKSLQLTA
jgi:hypothetical protein